VIVVGIDGGGTTGISRYDTETGVAEFIEVPDGVQGFERWWHDPHYTRWHDADVIVAEKFDLRNSEFTADLTTVKINEFLRTTGTDISWQTPTAAKFKLPISILKRAGLYPKRGEVKGGHAVDGIRHVVTYLSRIRDTSTLERVWPKGES
jgi:hypothetical protein